VDEWIGNDNKVLREQICVKKTKKCKKIWSDEQLAKLEPEQPPPVSTPSSV
jgi:hypothetical protein